MLLRKTPLSKRLTADEIESKLKDVVCINIGHSWFNPILTCNIPMVLATGFKICSK